MLEEHQLNEIAFIIEKAIAPNLKHGFYVKVFSDYEHPTIIEHKFVVEYFDKDFHFTNINVYIGGSLEYNQGSLKRELDYFKENFGRRISEIVSQLKAREVEVDAQLIINTEPMFS